MALKVGVIGCSGQGRNHALGYKLDGRAQVVGIAAASNLDRAKKLAGEVGAEIITLDYHDLLRNPEIDAVSIVTPTHLHLPWLLRPLKPENMSYARNPWQ